jgi:hypothetical protein
MGSGSGSQTSAQKFQPPAYATPYISRYLSALGILDNPFSGTQVPQQQIAGLSGLQKQGLGQISGEAGQAAGLGNAATSSAENIINGGNLNVNSNPALQGYLNSADQQLINQYQMATAPNITAQAVAQGGLGSSGANQAQQYGQYGLGQDIASQNANIYNDAYNAGIQQQTSVLGQAPGLQAAAFTPSQGLLTGGALQQGQQQNVLNAQYQNQQNQFALPYQQLGQYGAGVQGMAGLGGNQISTTSNPGAGSFK